MTSVRHPRRDIDGGGRRILERDDSSPRADRNAVSVDEQMRIITSGAAQIVPEADLRKQGRELIYNIDPRCVLLFGNVTLMTPSLAGRGQLSQEQSSPNAATSTATFNPEKAHHGLTSEPALTPSRLYQGLPVPDAGRPAVSAAAGPTPAAAF